MNRTDADHKDADLILKLYGLRRETVMREARRFMLGADFSSTDTVLALAADFEDPNNAYFRQVISYWEMAASFVLHGILSPALYADNCHEGLYLFAKLKPHLAALREVFHPELFAKTERMLAENESIRREFAGMEALLARTAGEG